MSTQNYHLCFETLANPLRIQILAALKQGPLNVNQLTKEVGMERSRISHSLQDLRKCKYVIVRKKGKQMLYSLNDQAMETQPEHKSIFQVIDTHVKHFCGEGCHKAEC